MAASTHALRGDARRDVGSAPSIALAAPQDKKIFETLDGLRGVAALAVVSLHFGKDGLMGPFMLRHAYIAVDLFFLMSGVVLSRAYDDRLAARLGTIGFMKLRLLRLYPLYLMSLMIASFVVVGLALSGVPIHWPGTTLLLIVVCGLFLLPAPLLKDQLFPLNDPAWSLLFELLSNLVFAPFFGLLRGRVLNGLIMFCGLGLATAVAVNGSVDGGYNWPTFAVGATRIGYSFFLGVLLARALREGRLPLASMHPLLLMAAVIVTFMPNPSGASRLLYDLVMVLIVYPLIIVAAVQNESQTLTGLNSFMGVISYPIYVLHRPIESLLISVVPAGAFLSPWVGIGIVITLAPISWFAAHGIDSPVRKWMGENRVIARLVGPRALG